MRQTVCKRLKVHAQENAVPVRKKIAGVEIGGIQRHGWIVPPQYNGEYKRYMYVCLGIRRMYLGSKKGYKSLLSTDRRPPMSSADRLAMACTPVIVGSKWREAKGSAKRRIKIIGRATA
jgi:hypothetical protein